MPVYNPPPNPLLGPVTPESAAGDLMMASPLGMMGAAGRLGFTPAQWLRQAVNKARYGKQLMGEITPSALEGAPRVMRPASPPNFTPQEIDGMNDVIERWLKKIPRGQ